MPLKRHDIHPSTHATFLLLGFLISIDVQERLNQLCEFDVLTIRYQRHIPLRLLESYLPQKRAVPFHGKDCNINQSDRDDSRSVFDYILQ
jgi:hypothetical protein